MQLENKFGKKHCIFLCSVWWFSDFTSYHNCNLHYESFYLLLHWRAI